jgi:hypothetical protein
MPNCQFIPSHHSRSRTSNELDSRECIRGRGALELARSAGRDEWQQSEMSRSNRRRCPLAATKLQCTDASQRARAVRREKQGNRSTTQRASREGPGDWPHFVHRYHDDPLCISTFDEQGPRGQRLERGVHPTAGRKARPRQSERDRTLAANRIR